MRVDSTLYLRMIGDYYLHAYVLKHSDIVQNNYTSSIIQNMFNETSKSIYGQLLKYGNKIKISIGLFKIDVKNNIKFYDIYNNQITDYYGIVSPFDGSFYTDSAKIIKQANTYRVSNGLCYIVRNGDVNFIMELTESIKKMSVSHFAKAIVNKILLFNPDNKKFITDMVSIILGAPYCLSPNGETVLKVHENYIETDKNGYEFETAVSYPEIGTKLNFCEPVVKLCSVNDGAIKYNINHIKLNKIKSFNNKLYADTISKTLANNLIYINIPIEIASGNSDILKDVSYVFKNLKIIFAESISSKLDKANAEYAENSKNILNSYYIVNVSEKHSLTVDYYNENSQINFSENAKSKITNNESAEYNELYYISSVKKENEVYNHKESDSTLYLTQQNVSLNYNDSKKSTLKDFNIVTSLEKELNYVFVVDSSDLFNDQVSISVENKTTIKPIETEKETIVSHITDYMMSQSDSQIITSILKENIDVNEKNIKNSSLTIMNSSNVCDKMETSITSHNYIEFNGELKTFNIDKEDVSVYNTNSFETLTVEIEAQIIKTDNEMSVIVKDILNTNDKMLVDSDTNIDKE